MIRHLLSCTAVIAALTATTLPIRAAEPSKPLAIHALLPLTGPASFLGSQQKQALDIGAKLLKGRGVDVDLIYHDDQANPQIAVQLISQLSGGDTRVILGPALRAGCVAVYPLLKDGPLDYCASPTMHADPGSFVFSTNVDTYEVDRAMMRYASSRGWKRIALITSSDATGNDAVQAFNEILKDPDFKDVSFVERMSFNPGDVSVGAQLARIGASKPDAIFAWSTGAAMATVFKGIIQAGLSQPVATSWGNMTYQQMNSWADFLPKELYFPTTPWTARPASQSLDPQSEAAQKEMTDAFQAAGAKPDSGTVTVWDPLFIIAQAYKAAGPTATPAQLRDQIAHMKGFVGINGPYDFEKYPQRGLGLENAVVTKWMAARGTWELVSAPAGQPLSGIGK